jgi:hypothetical protein
MRVVLDSVQREGSGWICVSIVVGVCVFVRRLHWGIFLSCSGARARAGTGVEADGSTLYERK